MECPDELKVEVMEKIAEATCEFEVDTTDGVKILTEEGWVIIDHPELNQYSDALQRQK